MEERFANPYPCWLYGIEGIGNKTISSLLSRVSCAEEIY